MRKIIIPIILLFLFMTVRLPAQNTQVSPVAGLNQQNTSVVNNNLQILQTGINGVFGLFSQYFTGGLLNTANGGTGANLSQAASGDTLLMVQNGVVGVGPSVGTHGNQLFTSSGTFISPITGYVWLTMSGSGGLGGGGSAGGHADGGGGSSAEVLIKYPFSVIINNSYTVIINTGNSASVSFSSIGVTGGVSGGSGNGGTASSCQNTTSFGQDTPNSYCLQGQNGFAGNGGGNGGAGGSGFFGVGGNGLVNGAPGTSGIGFGAGGAGGSQTGSQSGGNGAPGFIFVEW